MATIKKALFSPAVNAQQQMPNAADEQQLFEDKFGQMAYQAFSSKFPDLVTEIVTFKILDADLATGTAVGAFILEQESDYVYVPAVLSENELKPFDLMYVKAKDIFLPLTNDWLEEVKKGTISSLGEGSKLPETVPTDVDIRNIVVPPTTGRYSYASYNSVSPRSRLEAQATEPLGRKLTKIAGVGPFPGNGQPGMQSDFNPQLWATFVEQFQRTQQQTPGQALDSGSLDVETMAKMYKSHTKTWEMMADPSANPLANAQMPGLAADGSGAQAQGQMPQQGQAPQQAQPQAQAPGMPPAMKMGSLPGEIAQDLVPAARPRTIGSKLEKVITNLVRNAGIGAVTGGVANAAHNEGNDIGGAAARGALGGTALGFLGGHAAEELAAQTGAKANPERLQSLGRITGAMGGGYLAGRANPTQFSMPSMGGNSDYATRYAADHGENLKSMFRHAQKKKKPYTKRLPEFLAKAPSRVKKAYLKVLSTNPELLKKTAELYGEEALIQALSETKTASGGPAPAMGSPARGSLRVADRSTKPGTYTDFFGEAAPAAFKGVLMRGYYFDDTRPKLNLAVHVETKHDYQDTLGTGIYRLFTSEGSAKNALVFSEPFDLTSDARITFPRNDSRVKRPQTRVPFDEFNKEPNSAPGFERRPFADEDVGRSHDYRRLAVLENGDFVLTNKLFGELSTEGALKGSKLYNTVMKDGTSKPSKGTGMFITKRGASYLGTLPVEISELSTGSNGVIRGKISSQSGFGVKSFVIDPRSPINRPMKMKDESLVIIPAGWQWMSLGKRLDNDNFMSSSTGLSDVVMNALGSMGVHEAVVRNAGQSMYDVDGTRTLNKSAALQLIASKYYVHASAAEAMLKIASHQNVCRAHIVSPEAYGMLKYRVKIAQGEAAPQTSMGGPPAMQQPLPPPVAMPPLPGAAPGLPPAMQNAPAPAPEPQGPSPVDQAFGEAMDGLQQQMTALQAQLDVLNTVQQRAQQIAGGGGADDAGAPPAEDPSMQGMPPGMSPDMGSAPDAGAPPADPNAQAGMDPNAQAGMDPNDPNAQAAQPSMPIMRTEEPSSDEIASQINPAFLQDAANLHETGAFDAGTIASLARNGNMKSVTSQYAASLEESVDDLGRTLLTLYMQEPKLKEQLGDDTFLDLETQLRDTFQGLGKLVLSLTHNASMLDPNAIA